jgi:hypothetical protein
MIWISDKKNSGKFDVLPFTWHKYEVFVKASSRKFGYIAFTHVDVIFFWIATSSFLVDVINIKPCCRWRYHFAFCCWHIFKSEKENKSGRNDMGFTRRQQNCRASAAGRLKALTWRKFGGEQLRFDENQNRKSKINSLRRLWVFPQKFIFSSHHQPKCFAASRSISIRLNPSDDSSSQFNGANHSICEGSDNNLIKFVSCVSKLFARLSSN